MRKNNWLLKKKLSDEFQNKFPEINEIILQLLYDRNLDTQERIDEFLNPDYSQDLHDPFLFKDMDAAVDKILGSISGGKKITVHGDYDADGVCGSVILVNTLKKMGADVDVYIPHREKEGYGINSQTIDYLQSLGTNLIITTDCGISNKIEIDKAKDLGIDVIITDHHHVPPNIPDCLIINPHRDNETYPFKDLSGAGVAFKLVQGLLKRYKEINQSIDWEAFEKWLLDIVAIGTVADLVPILGENRTLVKYGLVVINKTKRFGLKYLFEVAALNSNIDTHKIAFQIGPRLNSAGRMNHASTAYKLLMSENITEAQKLALELNGNNQQRQKLTEKIIEEVKRDVEPFDEKNKIIFDYNREWPLGVVGLVAGKLSEEYNRPAFILGNTEGKITGSGRGIPEFNCIEAIEKINHLFERYGGHAAACGFTLKNESDLEEMKKNLIEIAEKELSGKELKPDLFVDLEIGFKDITWDLIEAITNFEPFGEDNEKPRFVSYGVKVLGLETVGNENKHLRLILTQDNGLVRKAIGFCFGEWCKKINVGDLIDLVYEIDVNEWNGNREIQLKVVDLKMS